MRVTVPFAAAAGKLPEGFGEAIGLMEYLVKESIGRETLLDAKLPIHADGAALRNLRPLLEHLDPPQTWGRLQEVRTPEGHYLWLCEEHARPYRRWTN